MSHPFGIKLTAKGASMDMKTYKALPEEYRPRAVAALKAAAVPYSPLKIRAAPAGVVSVRTVANPVRAPLKTMEPMARVEEDIPGTMMKKEEPEKFIWYENIKRGTQIVYGMGREPERDIYGIYINNTDTDFRRKRIVLDVLPAGRFLVGSLAAGDPRVVFKINDAGDWLVDADGGPLKVYSIDGLPRTDPRFKRGARPVDVDSDIAGALMRALSKYPPAEHAEILSGFGSTHRKKAAPKKAAAGAADARAILDGSEPFPKTKAKAIVVRDADKLRPLLKASGIVRSDADIERFAERLRPLVLSSGILLWRTPKGNLRAEAITA